MLTRVYSIVKRSVFCTRTFSTNLPCNRYWHETSSCWHGYWHDMSSCWNVLILTCALAKVPYLKCSVMAAGSRFMATVQKLCRRHFAGVTRQRVLRHKYNNVSNTVSYLKRTDASLNNKIKFVSAKIDLSTQRLSAYVLVALRQLLSRRAPRSRWLSLRVATTRRGRTPPTSPPRCSPAACTRSCCGLINTSVAPHYDIYMYVDILNQSK